ncbi:MAG: ABC transporter permease [Ruminococcaceae bacterium]|nr:ABC transporter permease [Oscillospiraceae bacterium]
MTRLYAYRLLVILRDRGVLFWSIGFPILLATFFFLGFGNLTSRTERFEPIPVAVVDSGDDATFATVLEQLGTGDDAVLKLEYLPRQQARQALEAGKVDGVIEIAGELSLLFKEEGVRQSILKGILDRYVQVQATLEHIAAQNPESLPEAMATLMDTDSIVKRVSLSGGSLDYSLQYFYALIAMTCLYGGFSGLTSVMMVQATQSPLGARRSITPTRKWVQTSSDFLASLTLTFAEVCLLLLYMRFVLGLHLGSNAGGILLLCLAGCACGVMLGMLLGALPRIGEGGKIGLLIAVSLTLSFLGGLMYTEMRHIVERTVPFLNRINPVSLIVDGFYVLDTYGVGPRFWFDFLLLLGIALVMGVVSVVTLRRRQYASI